MAGNAPRLRGAAAQGSKPGAARRVVPQGQGPDSQSRGGPPADVSKHAVGGRGSTTVNSRPAS